MKTKQMYNLVSVCMSVVFLMGIGLLSNQPAMAAENVIKWKCEAHWPTSSSSYKGSLLVVVASFTRTGLAERMK